MKKDTAKKLKMVIEGIAQKIERHKKLVAGGCPAVGIFWFLKKKSGRLEMYAPGTPGIPYKLGEDDGEFINYPVSHYHEWRDMKVMFKKNVKNRIYPEPFDAYIDKEYDDAPRGRIVYSKLNKKFYVHVTKSLMKPRIKTLICKEFRLPANTVFMNDEHYG